MKRAFNGRIRGLTLVETLIAGVINGIILAAIVFGAASLQRTFTRAGDGFRASADEMLLADYLASDLRAALGATVTTSGSNQKVTLTLPDYLNTDTRTPRTPIVTPGVPAFGKASGTVNYGNAAAPLTVTYRVSSGRLVRTAGTTTSIISKTSENFQLNVTDRDVAADFSIRFTSRFARQNSKANEFLVTVNDSIYFRNKQRN